MENTLFKESDSHNGTTYSAFDIVTKEYLGEIVRLELTKEERKNVSKS